VGTRVLSPAVKAWVSTLLKILHLRNFIVSTLRFIVSVSTLLEILRNPRTTQIGEGNDGFNPS